VDTREEQAWVPDSLGVILWETIRIVGRHPLSILAIGCLPWIAVDVVAAFLGVEALGWEELKEGIPPSLKGTLLKWGLYQLVTGFVLYPLVEGALTRAMGEACVQSSMSLRSAFRGAGRRWGALIGAGLLVGCLSIGIFAVIAGGGFLLASFLLPESWQAGKALGVIPGAAFLTLVYCLRWSLIIPVVVLEGVGPGAALRRSRELTQGCRGRIFVLTVVGMGFARLLSVGMQWVAPEVGTGAWLDNGLEFVALPLVYLGQRVRQEGYTATALAAALELEA
jgi:hypothetical protein